jgi:hypothetical protein
LVLQHRWCCGYKPFPSSGYEPVRQRYFLGLAWTGLPFITCG